MPEPLRLLAIGAHPDDCDISAGGLAALFAQRGDVVKFVSMTNGDTGHQRMGGGELARRREAEAHAAARVIGIDYQVMDNHSGELDASIHHRKSVIRLIRAFRPDLVLTHSPDDYHPDHRYTSMLVQDSAYVVTVPGMCALTPHLARNPVYAYMHGAVSKSQSFVPDLMVDITSVLDKKLAMVRCHESQFLEWIPYNQGRLDEVPHEASAQRRWLDERFTDRFRGFADHFREQLMRQFGPQRGRQVACAEGVQACPFGSALDQQTVQRLFGALATDAVASSAAG
ncbi:MAG: PIG-L deacetylase family protein [Phycisphaeraceae bacterium]